MRHDDKFYRLRVSQNYRPAILRPVRFGMATPRPVSTLTDGNVTRAQIAPRRRIDLSLYQDLPASN